LIFMATNAGMAEALARLWTKFLPEITQRVDVLETAAQTLSVGLLSTGQRDAAHAAAHKLAGTLGTFGLHRGTELARNAELVFEGHTPLAASSELSVWIGELRSLIDSRR
jgi:HPt (histidine-containing phosphotransfer) domain-containing protein